MADSNYIAADMLRITIIAILIATTFGMQNYAKDNEAVKSLDIDRFDGDSIAYIYSNIFLSLQLVVYLAYLVILSLHYTSKPNVPHAICSLVYDWATSINAIVLILLVSMVAGLKPFSKLNSPTGGMLFTLFVAELLFISYILIQRWTKRSKVICPICAPEFVKNRKSNLKVCPKHRKTDEGRFWEAVHS